MSLFLRLLRTKSLNSGFWNQNQRLFFDYVQNANEGERLIVKINSHVSEAEIYDDFAKIYRRYKALNRQNVGDYFFKEIDDLVDKLCDDFEKYLSE